MKWEVAMNRSNEWGVILGAGVLGAALLLAGTVFTRAWIGGQADSPASAMAPETPPPATPVDPTDSTAPDDPIEELLRLAAEQAPFDSERRPPPARYQLPDEVEPVAPAPAPVPEAPPAPPFRLLGTIAGTDGGVAVMEVEGSSAHVLLLGEELFGYRVSRIGPGSVTMTGDGRSLSLSVPGPMATGAAEAEAGGAGPPATAEERREQIERATAAQEQFVRQLEQLRALQDRGAGQIEVLQDRIIFTGQGGARRELAFPPGASVIRQGGEMQMQLRLPPGGDR